MSHLLPEDAGGAITDSSFFRQYADRHPSTQQVMRHFEYSHLPPDLRSVSEQCAALAHHMITELPDGPELTVGLRKLLEAKDCFVRTAVGMRGSV